MTRRGLIRRLLLVVGIRWSLPWRAGRSDVEAAQLAAQERHPPPPGLSASDVEDLVAFAETVVGSGPLGLLERGFLADHIRHQVPRADGYYLAAYRTGVHLLTQLAGTRFASLTTAQRYVLVTRHRLNLPLLKPDEPLGPFPEAARTVRAQVVGDLIGGYYGSPAGWAVVGYDAHPGQCSDLTRYTRAGSA